jgi:hypothetical protein
MKRKAKARAKTKTKAKTKAKTVAMRPTARPKKVVLLSGGNPQIAKADGDAPVQAYIEAMPGWKSAVGKRLDEVIERALPGVRKAVKWNSPLYGADERSFFMGVHVFEKYIKVAFFRGVELKPELPVGSKDPYTRYVHLFEGAFDEQQMSRWVKQAAALPGWVPNAKR